MSARDAKEVELPQLVGTKQALDFAQTLGYSASPKP